jgi:hypothetical protein
LRGVKIVIRLFFKDLAIDSYGCFALAIPRLVSRDIVIRHGGSTVHSRNHAPVLQDESGNAVKGVCVITANPKAQAPRPRGPVNFKQRDITRVLKAAAKADCKPARVEIEREGKIIMIFTDDKPAVSEEKNPWHEV